MWLGNSCKTNKELRVLNSLNILDTDTVLGLFLSASSAECA